MSSNNQAVSFWAENQMIIDSSCTLEHMWTFLKFSWSTVIDKVILCICSMNYSRTCDADDAIYPHMAISIHLCIINCIANKLRCAIKPTLRTIHHINWWLKWFVVTIEQWETKYLNSFRYMEKKLQFEPLKQIIFSNRDSAILLFNYTNSLCIGFLRLQKCW